LNDRLIDEVYPANCFIKAYDFIACGFLGCVSPSEQPYRPTRRLRNKKRRWKLSC